MQPADAEQGDLELAIRTLKRGLMAGNDRAALPAYRQLYEAGAGALPLLDRELRKFPFTSSFKQSEGVRLLAGLLALERDLDEEASDRRLDAAISHDCSNVVKSLLRSVRRISKNDFRRETSGNIEIWEHTTLDGRYEARLLVEKWLGDIPEAERADISRIIIKPSSLDDDWSGKYQPVLGVITLAWMTFLPPGSYLLRLLNADHRHTLFHEIGHHVHRHWYGQDPEQERQANAYASATRARTRPLWLRPLIAVLQALWGVTLRASPSCEPSLQVTHLRRHHFEQAARDGEPCP